MKIRNLFILCFVAISFCFNPLFAKKIDVNQVKQVASNFYTEKYNASRHTSLKSVSITETYMINDNAETVFYIFNMSNNGFIMVAADDIVYPVLGYSFESTYDENNQSPEFVYWINNYKKQITSDRAARLSATPEINNEWTRLNKTSDEFASSKNILSTVTVGPLCSSTWDQGCCYNALCPKDTTSASASICHHVVTGCVATSMAQVMYYWRYPLQGVGSHTDSYINYGTLSANFGTTTYNWNAMTNSCVGTDSAIATLIYHCGVAVNMDYGVSGSSAAMTSAVTAFKNYFKYTAVSSANKSSYTWAAWDTLIASQLNLHYAVIYSGQDPTAGGHAWVCDGYQFNGSRYFFHFNWGWSGSSDGYYYTDNLNPSGMDFYEYNSIIYNIYPPSGYPYYCSGTTETLTSPVGTFEDGSGPATDYQNNDNCSWLIYPYCGGHINLTFNNFSTAPGDSLIVYNGSNASAPVLHAYCGIDTGSALPTAISSTSPTVFLKFVSDGSGTAAGWKISYTTTFPVFCSSLTTLTAASGSFSNGSGACNYDNNTNCKWLIKPTGAATVTLNFSSFNTQKTNDYVKITDNASHVLGIFSGDTIPPAVTSTNGQMLVMFTTDASVTAPGWSASYSSTSGLEEYNSIKELAVYPNPAKDEMHISFIAEGIDHATLEIIDLAGQIVYLQKVNCSNGAFSKDINISDYAKGIYNLRILTSREAVNKKIVVE